MKNTIGFLLVAALMINIMQAQAPLKALDHSDFDSWKALANPLINSSGTWSSYEINPQEGDGKLYAAQTTTGKQESIDRGYRASFDANGNFLVFQLKNFYAEAVKAKRKKGYKAPKDSLGVWNLTSGVVDKFPKVHSFKLTEEGDSWLAYIQTKEEEKEEEREENKEEEGEEKEEKAKKKKKKEDIKVLAIKALNGSTSYSYEKADQYAFSKNGSTLAFSQNAGEEADSVLVSYLKLGDTEPTQLYNGPGSLKGMNLSEDGSQVVFLLSTDTTKQKTYALWHSQNGAAASQLIDSGMAGFPNDWVISEHATPYFSKAGDRLFLETMPAPLPPLPDTLAKDEIVKVDIWNWQDTRLQPQQLVQKNRDEKDGYEAVYHIGPKKFVQLANEEVHNMRMDKDRKGNMAIGINSRRYSKEISWASPWKSAVYLVNLESGAKKEILVTSFSAQLSPNEDYVLFYAGKDSSWHSYNVASGRSVNLTKDLAPNFYYELNSIPRIPGSWGFAGFTEDGKYAWVYDQYDIWQVDLAGRESAKMITRGFGRANKIRMRFEQLDDEAEFINTGEPALLNAFNTQTRSTAFYQIKKPGKSKPELMLEADARITRLRKAKNSDQLILRKETYRDYPDLYSTNTEFNSFVQLSTTNPQQKDYAWGNVELVKWNAHDGTPLEGLLYKPDNFDPNKQYPLMVYFYERMADNLHRHYMPQPFRSGVQPTFFVSRDYVYFVPNIEYGTGTPGDDAYNCVVSGTEFIAENNWIDKARIGIQGHSWGGYQTAYIITKTNMYAAASAGAPVVNMTSAYGGIRWASGMSRMFQYERTQSRIGGTLWEKTDLYLKNSPLFEVPKIETPLIMMHNDNDGAVPWYQGIEMFVAMRRLNKPAWLINYNGEGHGLSKRVNKEDWTIRTQQFFDHYLQGAPMPVWMGEGIPAVKKGHEYGLGAGDGK